MEFLDVDEVTALWEEHNKKGGFDMIGYVYRKTNIDLTPSGRLKGGADVTLDSNIEPPSAGYWFPGRLHVAHGLGNVEVYAYVQRWGNTPRFQLYDVEYNAYSPEDLEWLPFLQTILPKRGQIQISDLSTNSGHSKEWRSMQMVIKLILIQKGVFFHELSEGSLRKVNWPSIKESLEAFYGLQTPEDGTTTEPGSVTQPSDATEDNRAMEANDHPMGAMNANEDSPGVSMGGYLEIFDSLQTPVDGTATEPGPVTVPREATEDNRAMEANDHPMGATNTNEDRAGASMGGPLEDFGFLPTPYESDELDERYQMIARWEEDQRR